MRHQNLWIMVIGLALAPGAHVAGAEPQQPILGQWCGIEGYMITVDAQTIRFHPRDGAFTVPAFDVRVAEDRVEYSQRYDNPGYPNLTVACTFAVTGDDTATETCNSTDPSVYPRPGSTAELHRCGPKPVPDV
jgi:hypothetical protein